MVALLRICTCSRDKYIATLLILIGLLVTQIVINMMIYSNHSLTSIIKMDGWFQSVINDADTMYIPALIANNSYRESRKNRESRPTVLGDNGTMFLSEGYTSNYTNSSGIPICPLIPANSVGRLTVKTKVHTWKHLNALLSNVQLGGRWHPNECRSRHRVAIIIPFRDRVQHLKIFLQNIHPFLQRQQLDYAIYVIELSMQTRFNRAMLMNIGFVEAMKLYDYQCFVFHDVDLIPEDDRNIYSCPIYPRHMSGFIDKFNYMLPYENIFGGVSALTKEQFVKVNGFSNMFFGWGGEDDDMYNRVVYKGGYKIIRYLRQVGRYKMLSHPSDNPDPERDWYVGNGNERWDTDGLNSLKYKLIKQELRKLYTWILVHIDEKEVRGME